LNARRDAGPRLGRGLAALLGEAAVQDTPTTVSLRQVPVDLLEPNPFQPRTTMDPVALDELADSIRRRGVLQPLVVRPHPDRQDRFQIVAGERRWRAAGAAGLHEVPVVVNPMTDAEASAVALVENLQRQDLNPIDEAEGYHRLLTQFQFTHDALGQSVGKSRSHISNVLRLLNLPDAVKHAVRAGDISAGHARALLAHPAPEVGLREVLLRQLSVRQTEALASRQSPAEERAAGDDRSHRDTDTAGLERALSEQLGLAVKISFNGKRGVIQFHYSDLDQLDHLLGRLGLSQ
jgi:ParB family chromosome partitioning protein